MGYHHVAARVIAIGVILEVRFEDRLQNKLAAESE